MNACLSIHKAVPREKGAPIISEISVKTTDQKIHATDSVFKLTMKRLQDIKLACGNNKQQAKSIYFLQILSLLRFFLW